MNWMDIYIFKNILHDYKDYLLIKFVEEYYPTAHNVVDCLFISQNV